MAINITWNYIIRGGVKESLGGWGAKICRYHAKIWSALIPMQSNGPPHSETVNQGRTNTWPYVMYLSQGFLTK